MIFGPFDHRIEIIQSFRNQTRDYEIKFWMSLTVQLRGDCPMYDNSDKKTENQEPLQRLWYEFYFSFTSI